MNFNSLTVGSHKLFPKYQIRTGDSKHCTVLMILQDISYIKRVDNKEKSEGKNVKIKFSEWKNITNVPDLSEVNMLDFAIWG